MYIVVSYYTVETIYAEIKDRLEKSLVKFNIPYHIESVRNLGTWIKNVNYKPTFILNMMKKYPDRDIVYVDADAEFMSYPKLFDDYQANFAVHEFIRTGYTHNPKGKEVLSGTIFIKNSEQNSLIIHNWQKECKLKPQVCDQKSLEKILNGRFDRLPLEYCKIFDRHSAICPNPVIVHWQASRIVRENRCKNLKYRGA